MSQNSATAITTPNVPLLEEGEREQALIVIYEGYAARNYRLAPYSPDALIASRGYDALDNLKTMAAYMAPLTVLIDAVLYKGWRIKPALVNKRRGNVKARQKIAVEAADAFDWHLRNIIDAGDAIQDPRNISREMLDGVHIGFSVTEIEWRFVDHGPYKGQWGFKRFSPKLPKQIGFGLDPVNYAVRSIVNTPLVNLGMPGFESPNTIGLDIPLEKVVLYTFNAEKGLPYGRGVSRTCYKHSFVLNVLEQAHAIAMEKFAGPSIVAKAPAGDRKLMDAVRTALEAWRNGATIVLPDNIEADIVQASGGSFESFIAAKKWHAEQMAQAILLQQLTTNQGSGQGSYALGEVHQRTQEYRLASVRTDLEWCWTYQVARRWMDYNYGPEYMDLVPQFDLGVWDAAERSLIAKFFESLTTMGAVHPQEPMIREETGLAPLEDEFRTKLDALEAKETAQRIEKG
jgi:hypothetical protein